MKTKRNKIIGFSLLGLFLFMGIFSIIMFTKYSSFKILSIKKEYSVVSENSVKDIEIPLYFEKKNSFLTKEKSIKSVSIEDETKNYLMTLNSIKQSGRIEYERTKYYGFFFNLSFEQYDNFEDVVFIKDGKLKIKYLNGEEISFRIGNIELYLNTKTDNSNIQLMALESIFNTVDDKETIVGINISLRNDNNVPIKIESIKTLNKYYELDYLNYEKVTLNYKDDLKERYNDYSYKAISINETSKMDIQLNKNESSNIFIPLKYLNGIRSIDTLGLFITYRINNVSYTKVIDSFTFRSSLIELDKENTQVYEYRYK